MQVNPIKFGIIAKVSSGGNPEAEEAYYKSRPLRVSMAFRQEGKLLKDFFGLKEEVDPEHNSKLVWNETLKDSENYWLINDETYQDLTEAEKIEKKNKPRDKNNGDDVLNSLFTIPKELGKYIQHSGRIQQFELIYDFNNDGEPEITGLKKLAD